MEKDKTCSANILQVSWAKNNKKCRSSYQYAKKPEWKKQYEKNAKKFSPLQVSKVQSKIYSWQPAKVTCLHYGYTL